MGYRSPLEARVAKKTTKAIKDFNLIEDGDRIMVGLSGGKDSWALLQILDELRQRAPIDFSLVAVNVDSGYKDYKHTVIRPLVYVEESEARLYTKERELPIIGCCCPACGDLSLQRQRVKRLILDLEQEHAGVKQSMLKALGNVMPRHLLDTRLNPSGELRDSAALRLADEAAPTLLQI